MLAPIIVMSFNRTQFLAPVLASLKHSNRMELRAVKFIYFRTVPSIVTRVYDMAMPGILKRR